MALFQRYSINLIEKINFFNFKDSLFSILLRSTCVLSTIILCASIVNYHRIEVKIALIDSGADDWRVALSTERMIKLGIELAVCAVCPFPGKN